MKLFGEIIRVKAEMRKLNGISGHADNKGLMEWVGAFGKTPKHVFVLHGDDDVTDLFAARVENELGLHATAPYNGESWDLTRDVMLAQGNKEKIRRDTKTPGLQPKPEPELVKPKAGKTRENAAYTRLQEAGSRIAELIERMEHSSNKNKNKLANALFFGGQTL